MIELTEEQAAGPALDNICGGCPLAEGSRDDHEGDDN